MLRNRSIVDELACCFVEAGGAQKAFSIPIAAAGGEVVWECLIETEL